MYRYNIVYKKLRYIYSYKMFTNVYKCLHIMSFYNNFSYETCGHIYRLIKIIDTNMLYKINIYVTVILITLIATAKLVCQFSFPVISYNIFLVSSFISEPI